MKGSMKEYRCNFYELDFYDSFLDNPVIDGGHMTVRARDVILLTGLFTRPKLTATSLPECRLHFYGVSRSERKVYRYIGDPAEGSFAKPFVESDGPFPPVPITEELEHFDMEGVVEEPASWVVWEIEAQSFRLEIPDDVEIPE